MFVWICRGYECLHTGNSGEIFSIMAVVRSRECLTIMLGIQAEEICRKLRLAEFKIFLLRRPPIQKRNVKNNFSSHFQCQFVKNETVLNLVSPEKNELIQCLQVGFVSMA